MAPYRSSSRAVTSRRAKRAGSAVSVAPRPAGHALVEQLAAEGVQVVFGVPGESYIDALDAFYGRESPRFVTCRHEGGAAMAAEAASKLMGRPQACMVSRGPGAMNAAIGVHLASYDATPALYLVGQVPRRQLGLGAFQELDVDAVLGPIAKFSETVTDPERVPGTVARALRSVQAGLGGPAVVTLPEDVLATPIRAPAVPPAQPTRCEPSPRAVEEVAQLVACARRPLLVAGGAWSEEDCGHLAELAERWEVPVVSSFRRQDVLDNDHPCYAGTLGTLTDPRLAERFCGIRLGGRPRCPPRRRHDRWLYAPRASAARPRPPFALGAGPGLWRSPSCRFLRRRLCQRSLPCSRNRPPPRPGMAGRRPRRLLVLEHPLARCAVNRPSPARGPGGGHGATAGSFTS